MAKQLFFVTALSNAHAVKEKIEAQVPAEFRYELANNQWVVYVEGTSAELANSFGVKEDPHVGTGIVFPLSSYAGRAPATLWEWIKARAE